MISDGVDVSKRDRDVLRSGWGRTLRGPAAGTRAVALMARLCLAASLLTALVSASSAFADAPLFEDVTEQAGVASFVPTVSRDASPVVFPAFFKALGELSDVTGLPDNACGALPGPDVGGQPTCAFGPSSYVGGVLIADFDGDGRQDLFATNADGGANALYLNRGNDSNDVPRFEDVAAAAGVDFPQDQAAAAVAGDVDNDGWVDLYISNVGFDAQTEFARTSPLFAFFGGLSDASQLSPAATNNGGLNRLMLNRGMKDGRWLGFREADDQTVRGLPSTRSATPTLVDFDRDGDLDVFVAAHTNVFMIPTPTSFPIFGPVSGPGPVSKRVADLACFGNEEADPANPMGDGVDQDGDCVPRGGSLLFESRLAQTGELEFRDATRRLREAIDTATGQPNRGGDGRPYIDSFMAFDGVWFDYDQNGYPDLVMSNDSDFVGIFRNLDGERFELVSRTALLDPNKILFGGVLDVGAVGAWMTISHGDVNGDGLLDFYATNAGEGRQRPSPPNPPTDAVGTAFTQPLHALYINLGDGRFIDAAEAVDSREVKPGDPLASLAHPALDDGTTGMPETLNGHFAFGGQLFDFDADGDLDVFNIGNLAGSGVGTRALDPNGAPPLDETIPNGQFRVTNRGVLFENLGTTEEIEIETTHPGGSHRVIVPRMRHITESEQERAAVGLDNPFDGRGLAIGDLNGDGRVEIVTANVSGVAASDFGFTSERIGGYDGGLRIFQNRVDDDNGVLVLRLEGRRSNRSGIGAKVTVRPIGEGGGHQRIVRELSSTTGHRGNAGLDLIVGVGEAKRAHVLIEWPSGVRQRIVAARVDGDRTCLEVTEARGIFPVARAGRHAFGRSRNRAVRECDERDGERDGRRTWRRY